MKNNLVSQFLENINRSTLEKHSLLIKKHVKGRHGVYALYNGTKLYYVGKASNLQGRLKHHLVDKHAETWDRFSVYLTNAHDHVHELESLILRILMPKGNSQKGCFSAAEDLKALFKQDIKEFQKRELIEIFSNGIAPKHKQSRRAIKKSDLAGCVKCRLPIQFVYKGKAYNAHVSKSGAIIFNGKEYVSPSAAAFSLTGSGVNGWKAWKFQDKNGAWLRLDTLRKSLKGHI
ncbi:MAG: GIY-YIG nuclease family protein [Elusimicrobiales bacterium]|nr:GIY-YIG nuclease family protein [Elusimicrobiales bacterium]